MMSSNFNAKSAKAVWRNIAVAVFAMVFALLGLGVTIMPTRAADEDPEPLLITDPIYIGTATLGEYPQSYVGEDGDVTNAILLEELEKGTLTPTGNVYITSNTKDEIECPEYEYLGQRYVKATAQATTGTNGSTKYFRNNIKVAIGKTYFFNVEPIKWDIFRQNDQIIAVAQDLLVSFSFNALGKSYSSWKDSYLRNHLNNHFLNAAGLGNYAAPRTYYASTPSRDDGGEQLTDKAWILSTFEVKTMYTTNAERVKKSTDYAAASGLNNTDKQDGSSTYNTRTVNGADYYKFGEDGVMFNGSNTPESFFPAIALSEAAIAEIFDVPSTLPDLMYNAQDQKIEVVSDQYEWYNEKAMACRYIKDGEEVTEVKDAGVYNVTITVGTYQQTTTLTILPREVTVNGEFTAVDRTYDQKWEVMLIKNITETGLTSTDGVSIEYKGFMDDKNAGENKHVTITATLTGDNAKNYTLLTPQFETTVNIDPQTITITNIKAKDKVYDGTKQAILDTSDLTYTPQIFKGDDLTIWLNVEFDEATVGEHTVTVGSAELDGKDKNNYKLGAINDNITNLTAYITPRAITVTIKDQIVKEGTKTDLTYSITSGSIVGVDKDIVDTIFTLGLLGGKELDNLPVGEYQIVGTEVGNENYIVNFVNGTYRVLSEADWDALQTKEEPKDNNMWLIIIIVMAIAAFIGALVGIGLVIRSHDKNRDPKPKKDKKNKDKAEKPNADNQENKKA